MVSYIKSSLRSYENQQDQHQQKKDLTLAGAPAGDLERSQRGAQCWSWKGGTGENNNKRFKTSRFIIEYPLQHYEHLLNESSTEISELESSIELKYQAISKMQVQNTIKSDS